MFEPACLPLFSALPWLPSFFCLNGVNSEAFLVCNILADIEFILFEYRVGFGSCLDELFYKSLTFLSFFGASTGLSVVIGVFFLTSTTFPSLSIRIFIFLC